MARQPTRLPAACRSLPPALPACRDDTWYVDCCVDEAMRRVFRRQTGNGVAAQTSRWRIAANDRQVWGGWGAVLEGWDEGCGPGGVGGGACAEGSPHQPPPWPVSVLHHDCNPPLKLLSFLPGRPNAEQIATTRGRAALVVPGTLPQSAAVAEAA